MKTSRTLLPFIAAVILTVVPVACGSQEETQAQTNQGSTTGVSTAADSAQDRAARLAAQTQLRNARTDEESYFAEHESYAATAADLKTADPRLSPRVRITRGDATGFEISIQADDSQNTIYIIRKTGERTLMVDGNGNQW